ncbi:MAG: hypothetical protein ABI811_10520 [Acidobacteriota bacterium]
MITTNRVVVPEFSRPERGAARTASANPPATLATSNPTFAQQMAASIEGYLGQAASGSHLQIDIAPGAVQTSGSRQFVVTVTDSDVHATATALSAPPPAIPAVMGGMMYSGTVEAGPKSSGKAAPAPITNEVDAYWATQPAEVQCLRTMADLGERVEKGKELAQQGHLVDYDIMVWHQDPFMTMHIREGEGYTWTPAMGQPGITLAPGVAYPGMQGYDASHPLAGAIRVTTEFAKGLEDTAPWFNSPKNG